MTSIATLGIEVTTKGVQQAETDLGKLSATGAKVEAQVNKVAPAMQKAALSAKELSFATRGLPAQFTDIATSLATGQRPLNILLQQGGQLKDMFGGIGPAIRAMGSYLIGLVNPLTIAAALIGGLALALKHVEDESAGFNLALAKSGDFAGRSAEQLRDMADALNRIALVSRGDAVDALTQVAASGRFAGDAFDQVSEAAVRMKATTGQAIDDTVAAFKRIAADPLDALLKLNDAEHFLTQAQADRISALQDEGREQDAANEAIRIYAEHLDDVANKSEAAMPEMARRWATLKDKIGGATSAIGGYIARLDEALQRQGSFLHGVEAISRATNIYAKLFGAASDVLFGQAPPKASTGAGAGKPTGWNFAAANGGSFGGGAAIDSDAFRAKQKNEDDFARIVQGNLTKQQRLEADIANIRKVGVAAGKSELEIDKQIAAARARYAESLPKGRKPRKESTSAIANASDRFDDMVGSLRAELEGPLQKAEEGHLKRVREITQAAAAGKRSHEDLTSALKLEGEAYAQSSADIKQRLDDEVAQLTGPVAAAQQAHEDALRRIDELRQQATLSGEQYNAMLANEAKAYQQDMLAAQRAADPLHALLDDMRFELDVIGKSNAERAVMNELRRQGIPLMSAEAQGALATADAFDKEARAKQQSIDLMDDFRRGFSDALTDFVTGAKSAKQAFKDLFDGIAEQITRAIAQNWADQLFGQQGTSGGGSAGGWFQNILGALFGGGSGGNPWDAGNQPAGFASGGYTGDGPANEVAGLVHRGEYVIPASTVRQMRQGNAVRGDVSVIQNINVQGSVDPRTRNQLRVDTAREQRRQLARNS